MMAKRLCGCVGLRVNNDTVIEYCPLHEVAPDLLRALTEPLADSPTFSFSDDLDILATLIDSFGWHPTGDALRAKAQAIRAAIAAVKGEAG